MKNRNRKRRFVAEVESIEGRLLLSTAPQFTIKDLGVSVNATALNDLGQIVGYTWDGHSHAFFSDQNGGTIHILNGLPGLSYGEANSINNLGQVAGAVYSLNGKPHAFFFDPSKGTIQDIAGDGSGAFGMNRFGQVTGFYQTTNYSNCNSHAFLYSPNSNTIKDLGVLPGDTWAYGISVNDFGQVAGIGGDANGNNHAFLSDPNGGSLHNLGALNGEEIEPNQVNNLGQVFGTSPSGHLLLSDANGGALHYIDSNQYWFSAGINSVGEIVGATRDANLPFQYSQTLKIGNSEYNLSSLVTENSDFTPVKNGFIVYVAAINNLGQITIQATDNSGALHALLLTPNPTAPTITWSNPADIVYGTPISATQLNATADVPGTFTYSVPQGTVLHAGAAQVIQATFTPDDLVHYTTATAEVSINVLKAPLTVTANNAQVRYPFQIPPLTGTITGLVNGDTDVATYTTTAVQGSWAGYYPIVPHLTDPNYNITFVNGTLTIYWSVPPIG